MMDLGPISQIAKEIGINLDEISKNEEYLKLDKRDKVYYVVQKVINELAKQKGMEKLDEYPFNVDFPGTRQSIFNLSAFVEMRAKMIYLPPLYCVDRSFVPFTGPDDPNLQDNKKLQDFANKLTDYLGIWHYQEITWEDRMYLRMYLKAAERTERISDTACFIILHELGHVHHKHNEETKALEEKFKSRGYKILNFLTLGIFKRAMLDLQSRGHEKEADEFGWETGNYIKPAGGRHLFKSAKNFKPKGCKETLAYALLCFTTFFTHGSYGSRGKRIKKPSKIKSAIDLTDV